MLTTSCASTRAIRRASRRSPGGVPALAQRGRQVRGGSLQERDKLETPLPREAVCRGRDRDRGDRVAHPAHGDRDTADTLVVLLVIDGEATLARLVQRATERGRLDEGA